MGVAIGVAAAALKPKGISCVPSSLALEYEYFLYPSRTLFLGDIFISSKGMMDALWVLSGLAASE